MFLFHIGEMVWLIDDHGTVQKGTIRDLFQQDGREFARVKVLGVRGVSETRETKYLTPDPHNNGRVRPAPTSNLGASSVDVGALLLVVLGVCGMVLLIWLLVTTVRYFWLHPLF